MELTEDLKTKIIAMYGECRCMTLSGLGRIIDVSFADNDVCVILDDCGHTMFSIESVRPILKPLEKLSENLDVAREIVSLLKKDYHKTFDIIELEVQNVKTTKDECCITYIIARVNTVIINNQHENNLYYKIGINDWGGVNLFGSLINKYELMSDNISLSVWRILLANGFDLPNYYCGNKKLREVGLAVYEEDIPKVWKKTTTDAHQDSKE